ncbi:MAG TPA: PP2C family protein-serine/threonine phosphatase [Anaerolineaceae bacterium]|nr:PP2C family protein-serine/threonine phosphatase [Anaerolineaceae bacterium]
MDIRIAVAKINKYASSESGDTLEVVERPNGGVSVVLADGQTSGKGAKAISSMVVRKVISLLAEGVRDGAAARAASDYLYTERAGKVTACLNILSADLQTGTLVITRNNPAPVFVASHERIECLSTEVMPVGTSRNIRPAISEFQLEAGITVVLYTDGIVNAGDRYGQSLDVCTLLDSMLEDQNPSSQYIADTLLAEAIRLDQGRPNDDMSVVVLRISNQETDQIRRMMVELPVAPIFPFLRNE